MLVVYLLQGHWAPWVLVGVATIGNVLGAVVNWAIGRWLMRFRTHPRFPFSARALGRAERAYGRWGWLSLLGSWLPIVGDPLTLVAGMMHEPLWRFLLVVTLAKAGRYIALAMAVLAVPL